MDDLILEVIRRLDRMADAFGEEVGREAAARALHGIARVAQAQSKVRAAGHEGVPVKPNAVLRFPLERRLIKEGENG